MAKDTNLFLRMIILILVTIANLVGGAMLCAHGHYGLGIPAIIVGLFVWTFIERWWEANRG